MSYECSEYFKNVPTYITLQVYMLHEPFRAPPTAHAHTKMRNRKCEQMHEGNPANGQAVSLERGQQYSFVFVGLGRRY